MNTPERITTVEARRAFYEEWFTRVAALPGVEAVGGTTRIPLGSSNVTTSVRAEGNTAPAAALPEVEFRRGSPDYFRAMGMPLVRGRGFLASDLPADPPLVVINQTMARLVFGTVDPIGRRLQTRPDPSDSWLTVVGVVGDVRHTSLEAAPPPELYVTWPHNPANAPFMAVRTCGGAAALVDGCARWPTTRPPPGALRHPTMATCGGRQLARAPFVLISLRGFGVLALAAGRGRRLRRAGASGGRARLRTRSADGARRRPGLGGGAGVGPGPAADRYRHRHRPGYRAGGGHRY